MGTEKFDPKRQRMLTYITVVLVILAGVVSSFLRKDDTLTNYLTFHNEGYITISDASGNQKRLNYPDVVSVEYVQVPDFGAPVDGVILDEKVRLGGWKSETFGPYINCTQVNIDGCILIRTETECYAISYESEETTQKLQTAILDARDRLLAREETK